MKNPAKQNKATIYYHDIGDYLTREQKLKIVRDYKSIRNIEWDIIQPNEKKDWINMRDGVFETMIPLSPEKRYDLKSKCLFCINSYACITSRDAWCYNSSNVKLRTNIKRTIDFYNSEVERVLKILKNEPQKKLVDLINYDTTKFTWDRSQKESDAPKGRKYSFDDNSIMVTEYRPFYKQHGYMNRQLNNCVYQMPQYFPTSNHDNLVICASGVGVTKDYSCIVTNVNPDHELIGKCQCFPLYYYEENKNKQRSLFDEESNDDYFRHDGITDWILKEVRTRYGAKNITKEMIFYYVYGLLHSKDYRERFAADLKKSLPRIPIVDSLDDFMEFYKAGKELADLHLNYETVAPYPDVIVHGDRQVPLTVKRDPATGGYIQTPADDGAYDYFRVIDKMRFKSKDDKSVIIYNGNITIENIPQKAYEYIVNGKSAIEWIVERYCVSQDKKSLIKNDANDWAREHHKPRYILDLLLSVINVSVQTVDIVNNLPKLKFD